MEDFDDIESPVNVLMGSQVDGSDDYEHYRSMRSVDRFVDAITVSVSHGQADILDEYFLEVFDKYHGF